MEGAVGRRMALKRGAGIWGLDLVSGDRGLRRDVRVTGIPVG